MKTLNKGDIVYYTRILPSVGIYDLCELKIRTITDTYFVGVDKRDKQARLFGFNSIDDVIFDNRSVALYKVQQAEKNKKNTVSEETYYEEY